MHLVDGARSRSAVYSFGGGVLACHGAHDRSGFDLAKESYCVDSRPSFLGALTRPSAANPITDLSQVLADFRFRSVRCGPDLDNDSSKGASGENPKKKKKSKKEGHAEKVQQSPGLGEAPVVQGSPRVGEEVVECDSREKAPSEGALVRMESPGGPRVPPVKDRGTVPQRESCPRTDEENAEEGRSLVREDPLSGVDPEKVVEIDDSSLGDEEEDAEETQSPTPAETGEPLRDQEGLGLAEKSLSPAPAEQEGPRGRNEDGMVLVDAPEGRTVPEDVEAAEELDADLHVAAEETDV
ncbi:hypothetical protein Bca4012_026786 [Brassica carinata]